MAGKANASSVSEDATPKRAVASVFTVRPVVDEEVLSMSPLSDEVIVPIKGWLEHVTADNLSSGRMMILRPCVYSLGLIQFK